MAMSVVERCSVIVLDALQGCPTDECYPRLFCIFSTLASQDMQRTVIRIHRDITVSGNILELLVLKCIADVLKRDMRQLRLSNARVVYQLQHAPFSF